jgi:REP element-mobilizing transposase RayT
MITVRFFERDKFLLKGSCQGSYVQSYIDDIVQRKNWEIVCRNVRSDNIDVFVKEVCDGNSVE